MIQWGISWNPTNIFTFYEHGKTWYLDNQSSIATWATCRRGQNLFSLRRCCYSKYWCTIIRTAAWQPSQTAMDVQLQHLKANSIDCIHTYRQQCQITSHHHQQLWSNLSISNRHSTRDVACRVCDSISTHTPVILASIRGYHIQHRVLIVFLPRLILSKNYTVKCRVTI
jgi:hypothetical protein